MADDDLTLQPDFVFEEEKSYNTLVSSFENGVEQRRSMWSTPRSKFKLEFNNRTEAEKDVLVALFDAKLGAYDTLLWTNPNDSVQYTVRFETDSLGIKKKAFEIYDISFNFIQVK